MKQAIKILALPCMGMALLFSANAMSAPGACGQSVAARGG